MANHVFRDMYLILLKCEAKLNLDPSQEDFRIRARSKRNASETHQEKQYTPMTGTEAGR
jgi:hypothetical protein